MSDADFEVHEITWTPAKVSRLWDYYASHPRYRKDFFGYQAGHLVARYVRRKTRFREVETILDFGCGRGDVIAAFLKRTPRDQSIYGLDFSESAVAEVEARFAGADAFGGAAAIGDEPAPFPDGFFDLVLVTEVVEHLEDEALQKVLAESSRMLRPGGHLVVTTPNDEDVDSAKVLCPDCGCVFHRWQHVRVWTAASLAECVEGFGFATTHVAAVAWGSWWIKLASVLGLVSRWGLIYFARKLP